MCPRGGLFGPDRLRDYQWVRPGGAARPPGQHVAMESPAVDLSVIVVSFNTRHLLDEMMSSLHSAAEGCSMQVLVVDNASTDGSPAYILERFPEVELIVNDVNVGFGRANNQAVPRVNGRFVLLLNTDAFAAPGSVAVMLRQMRDNPHCGVMGLRAVGRDGAPQPSCRYFPTPLNTFLWRTGLYRWAPWVRLVDDMAWDHQTLRACDWVTGCLYLVRREVIDQVGLFDPRFFLYFEEVDHCRRVKAAGWQVLYCPGPSVVHLGGESAKTVSQLTSTGRQISAVQIESELLYFRKHYGVVGVASALMLSLACDAILAAKSVLKLRPLSNVRSLWRHSLAVASSAWHTRWGTQPTR